MDVNGHKKLFNITRETSIQVKELCFYCSYAFHSHSMIFNNEQIL